MTAFSSKDDDHMATEAVISRLEEMRAEIMQRQDALSKEVVDAAEKRHAMNNKLMGWADSLGQEMATRGAGIDASLRNINNVANRFSEMEVRMSRLEKSQTDLDHILRGVDGRNGIRSDVTSLKREMGELKTELKAVVLKLAGISTILAIVAAGLGVGAAKFFGS